jgi:quinol monooxygenase YgiN
MVKHIVFWKLKPELSTAQRDAALQQFKAGFEAMRGAIPGLISIEVGIDFLRSPESADVSLFCEFESRAALDVYQAHPLHQAMIPVVRDVRAERRVVDYEV